MMRTIAMLCAAASLLAQTFRSGVDGVRVDVRVTSGNRSVTGLTAADFELRDNGVLQHLDSVALEDVPLAVTLAFDVSESVKGDRLIHLKDATKAAVGALKPGDRAALLTFSELLQMRTGFTVDRAALAEAAGQITATGGTSLYDAAYAALTLRDDRAARSLVLLFTDGYDTASWLPAGAVMNAARRSDAVVYAVGLKDTMKPAPFRVEVSARLPLGFGAEPPPERFLGDLGDATGGEVLFADDTRDLRQSFVKIVQDFQSRYLLTYSPNGVAPGGWHTIDVKLRNRAGKVMARRGYQR